MQRLILNVSTLAILGLAACTITGLFGAWSVVADAFTHFRVHLAVLALLLAGCSLRVHRRLRLVAAAAVVAMIKQTLSA